MPNQLKNRHARRQSKNSTESMVVSFKKLRCKKLSTNFRDATEIVTQTFDPNKQLGKDQILIKIEYAGVNASDINYTAGKYFPGVLPPFDVGMEGLGRVAAIGKGVTKFKVGDAVGNIQFGSYSEYQVISERHAIPIPTVLPSILPILISGLTASIALEAVGEMKSRETVLVTAAAGGTGTFAVQLAKLAGNHVIGTCRGRVKAQFLKDLGCDRVIDYTAENLGQILKNEYPKGIDLVYESVGGKIFEDCIENLAVHGRLVVIGMISGYKDGSAWREGADARMPLPARLLSKSASMRGFLLPHYRDRFSSHLKKLVGLVMEGKIKSAVDEGALKRFVGVESVPDAVEYLYTGKNAGKVVVHIGKSGNEKAKL